jgi:hypothetical protein
MWVRKDGGTEGGKEVREMEGRGTGEESKRRGRRNRFA